MDERRALGVVAVTAVAAILAGCAAPGAVSLAPEPASPSPAVTSPPTAEPTPAVPSQSPMPTLAATATPALPSPSPTQPAASSKVYVTTPALTGLVGSTIAAILYEGVPAFAGGEPVEPIGLGGFTVPVDRDPFGLGLQMLHEGSPLIGDNSNQPPLMVPAGTRATLVLWVGEGLGPYSTWMPAAPIELACYVPVTFTAVQNTDVHVAGIPAFSGEMATCPTP